MRIFAAPPFTALFSPHLMIRYPLLLTQTDTGGEFLAMNHSLNKTITPLCPTLPFTRLSCRIAGEEGRKDCRAAHRLISISCFVVSSK